MPLFYFRSKNMKKYLLTYKIVKIDNFNTYLEFQFFDNYKNLKKFLHIIDNDDKNMYFHIKLYTLDKSNLINRLLGGFSYEKK